MLYCSQYQYNPHRIFGYSHSKTCHTVRGVPEAHIAAGCAALWWHPRHDEQKDLDQDEQANSDIPRLELRSFDSELVALTSDQVQSHGHQEEEQGLGVVLEVNNCNVLLARYISMVQRFSRLTEVERISCWRCNDHEDGHAPFQQQWADRRSERLGGDPELWPGKHALSANLTNESRLTDQNGDEVAE